MTRILVLGNDPQINRINFDLLSPDVITIGVNRIWLKHIPNYFFFTDIPILRELALQDEILKELKTRSIWYSSDWIKQIFRRSRETVPFWIKVYQRRRGIKTLPDSVTSAIQIFHQEQLIKPPYTFYLAGVSLNWQEPSHFWQELNYQSNHSPTQQWYAPRFDKIYSNFEILKQIGLNMISVNPNSRLNNLLRYENVRTLYKR